jgi:Tol biopolymer transport system component
LSPDGQRVAVDIQDEQQDIWIWHLVGETLTRLTLEPTVEHYPVWTRDGRRIIFSSNRAGAFNLFWQPADGTGGAERLVQGQSAQIPLAVSPDGAMLLAREDPAAGGAPAANLMVLPLEGERRLRPLVQTPFRELNGEISPDGRWFAYQSIESGRDEIYVRPFPNANDGRWQVSTSGGTRPLWARSGRELFYLTPDGDGLMVAPISGDTAFKAGNPQKLLDTRMYYAPTMILGVGGNPGRTYDVSPDGRRFLMIKFLTTAEQATARPSMTVVQNWS